VILTRKKRLILPSRFRQRGNFHMFPAGTQAIIGQVVPLATDMFIESTVASGICNAGITFNELGALDAREIYKRHSVANDILMGNDDAGSPVDHTGEWTTQVITASEWEVACVNLVSGSWSVEHAAVGVYTTLSSATDITWRMNRPGAKAYTPGTSQCIADFRLREIADTANFTEWEVTARAVQT